LEYLSNKQLYYSSDSDYTLTGEEAHHVIRVMRHRIDDKIFITDGNGFIRESRIISLEKEKITSVEIKNYKYQNEFKNLHFCIPILKNPDRLSFAIEKGVELGITNFIFYLSGVSVKKEIKLERYLKIGIAAMKQSLRAYAPSFQKIATFEELNADYIYYFDQNGTTDLSFRKIANDNQTVFIFGSESGFSNTEIDFLKDKKSLRLTQNRLRSETAIITAASILSTQSLQLSNQNKT
jgi:16S rRNA (uracil1498-N3)-methyltransferase